MNWTNIAPNTAALQLPAGVLIRTNIAENVALTYVPDTTVEDILTPPKPKKGK